MEFDDVFDTHSQNYVNTAGMYTEEEKDHSGLPRPHMYAIPPPPGQFSHHLYSDISQMQWNGHPGYSMATGYRGPYPGLSNSPLARFSPPGMLGHHPGMHPGMQHPGLISSGPKQELLENHRHPLLHGHDHQSNASDHSQTEVTPKKPHIKKPLNAFMLFMKEQRAKVAAECTLKESAAINQILGRRWHALDRSEQAKYYEMARKEKELHLQLYPGWSARDNYASHTKKKKRKRDSQTPTEAKSPFGQGFARSPPTIGYTETYSGEYVLPNSGSTTMTTSNTINNNNHHHTGFDLTSSPRVSQPLQYGIPETQKECTNPKKCRARFGLDQQSQWCKPCRRKKKCIRFMTGEDGSGSDDDDDDEDDDDLEGGGSVATVDSTTDLEGGSSQGSPAPSSSSLHGVGGMRGTGSRSGLPGNHHHPHSGGGTGNADHSDNLQHPVVSQSQPGSPPARLPLPLPLPHHHPGGVASAATSGSGSAATGSGGDGASAGGDSSTTTTDGSGGSSSKKYKLASHQNHSMSDSNQDSLHSTVNVGHHGGNNSLSSNNNVDAAVSGSSKPHVSTVLAT